MGRHRLRRILIAGEFALTLTLLAGAGLAIHSFWNLTHVDLGVRTDHILGFYLDSVPLEKISTRRKWMSYYRRVLAASRRSGGFQRWRDWPICPSIACTLKCLSR